MKNKFLEITVYDEDCEVCLGTGFLGLLINTPRTCGSCRGTGGEMSTEFKLDKAKHLDYLLKLLEDKNALETREGDVIITLENLEQIFNQYLTEVFP